MSSDDEFIDSDDETPPDPPPRVPRTLMEPPSLTITSTTSLTSSISTTPNIAANAHVEGNKPADKKRALSPSKKLSAKTSAIYSDHRVNPKDHRAFFKAEYHPDKGHVSWLIPAMPIQHPVNQTAAQRVKNDLFKPLFLNNTHPVCGAAQGFFKDTTNGDATCYILPNVSEIGVYMPFMIGFVVPFDLVAKKPYFVCITVSSEDYCKTQMRGYPSDSMPQHTTLPPDIAATFLCNLPERFPANACIMGWPHQALRWLSNGLYAKMIYHNTHLEISNIAQRYIKENKIDHSLHMIYLDTYLSAKSNQSGDRGVACRLFLYNTLGVSEVPTDEKDGPNWHASVDDFTQTQLQAHEERIEEWEQMNDGIWQNRAGSKWTAWYVIVANNAASRGFTTSDQNANCLCGNRSTFKTGIAMICTNSLLVRSERLKSENCWGALDHYMQWYRDQRHVQVQNPKKASSGQPALSKLAKEARKEKRLKMEAREAKKMEHLYRKKSDAADEDDSESDASHPDDASLDENDDDEEDDDDDDSYDGGDGDTDEDSDEDGDEGGEQSAEEEEKSDEEDSLKDLNEELMDVDDSHEMVLNGSHKKHKTAVSRTTTTASSTKAPVLPTQTRQHYANELSSITAKLSNMAQALVANANHATDATNASNATNGDRELGANHELSAALPMKLVDLLSRAHETLGSATFTDATSEPSMEELPDSDSAQSSEMPPAIEALFDNAIAKMAPTDEQMHVVIHATMTTLKSLTEVMLHTYGEFSKMSPEASKAVLMSQSLTQMLIECETVKNENATLCAKLNEMHARLAQFENKRLEDAICVVKQQTKLLSELNRMRSEE